MLANTVLKLNYDSTVVNYDRKALRHGTQYLKVLTSPFNKNIGVFISIFVILFGKTIVLLSGKPATRFKQLVRYKIISFLTTTKNTF